jgi:predicted DNA-binding transcriptional regulator AlpA
MNSIKPLPQMYNSKEICASLDVGRTWLWRAERDGRYPKGIRFGKRCVRYRADQHELFINGQWNEAANDE